MTKYEIKLNEDQEKITKILLKIDNNKTIEEWIRDSIYDIIE